MKLSKVRTAEEIIARFKDGQIIAIGGQTNQYMPDRLIDCVLESGARHLTIYSIDSSDPGHGVSLLVEAGRVDAMITTHVGTNPLTNAKIQSGALKADDIMITVESGIYGGVQAGGIDFGIGQNLYAMIGHHEQMDYYNGAGVDITYMGIGELGEDGSVNSTKMGVRCTGAGGFIDITQNAKKVVFLGTFTAGGAKYKFENRKLEILQEGKIRKMVRQVAQLSFNGPMARKKGQEVMVVTERAVFQLVKDGVELIEIAPGIDLQTQILDKMDFKPIISKNLRVMDERLFVQDGPFGLKLKEK